MLFVRTSTWRQLELDCFCLDPNKHSKHVNICDGSCKNHNQYTRIEEVHK